MRKDWLAFGCVLVLLVAAVIARAGGDATAVNAVLDKAIKAAGGPDKVAKLKNVTWKMKATVNKGVQVNLNVDGSAVGLDRLRLQVDAEVNGMQKTALIVMTDKNAWVKDESKVKEPPAKEFDVFRQSYFAIRATHMLAALKGKEYQLSHLGEVNIKDQPAIGVRISRKDRPDVNLFFDKKTHVPVKADLRVTGRQGQELDIEMFFSEHKEFAGLKHFSKLILKAGGEEIPMEISEIQPQEQLDATLFDRP